MADFWTPAEIAAMDRVEFDVNDRGKTVTFTTPIGAEVDVDAKPRPLEWQVTRGPGLSGVTTRFLGEGPASGTITIRMGGAEEGDIFRAAFDAGCGKYLHGPGRGQPAASYTVRHPRFTRYKPPVIRVHLKGDVPGTWDKLTQLETVVYEWEEDRKALPVLSSPSTAGGSKDKPNAKNKTTEALTKSIEQNTATITALTDKLAAS